jgi:hypothetical protein
MVTMTLEMDEATYQGLHEQLLTMARSAGMLFHSGRIEGDKIAVVDFWPSEAAWQSFAQGPMAEGMKATGIAPPDDVTVTPVLDADGA